MCRRLLWDRYLLVRGQASRWSANAQHFSEMTMSNTRPCLPRIDESFGAQPTPTVAPQPITDLLPLVQQAGNAEDAADDLSYLEPGEPPQVNSGGNEEVLAASALHSDASTNERAESRRRVLEFTYSMPNMVYTPVELGTIRIGYLEERENGAPRPVRDDQFRITRLVRARGEWMEHPLQRRLRDGLPDDPARAGQALKLREIPIRFQSNSPDLICRTRFEAFDANVGRSVCATVSAGKAKRIEANGSIADVACPGPAACEFAKSGDVRCKLIGRVHVEIEGQSTNVDNTFIFRSTSFNTLRNFEARLARYWALFGGRLRGVPFRLVLRSRTTAGSRWSRFYFVDLELREGVTLSQAKALADRESRAMASSGLDYAGWEHVIRAGLANGALVGDLDEAQMVREFYMGACDGELGTNVDDEPDPEDALKSARTGTKREGAAAKEQLTPSSAGDAPSTEKAAGSFGRATLARALHR